MEPMEHVESMVPMEPMEHVESMEHVELVEPVEHMEPMEMTGPLALDDVSAACSPRSGIAPSSRDDPGPTSRLLPSIFFWFVGHWQGERRHCMKIYNDRRAKQVQELTLNSLRMVGHPGGGTGVHHGVQGLLFTMGIETPFGESWLAQLDLIFRWFTTS